MKYTIKNTILFTAIVFILFGSLVCMDEPKKEDVALLPSNSTEETLSFLFAHKIDLFNPAMICSLSINNEWEKILKKVAPNVKKHVIKRAPTGFLNDNTVVWHKYGFVCGSIEFFNNKSVCSLHTISLDHGHGSCNLPNFQRCIPGFDQPRFNEEREFCFYGIGKFEITRERNHVMEFYLSYVHLRVCQLEVERNGPTFYNLLDFLAYPVLFKAFINSSFNYKAISLMHSDYYKDIVLKPRNASEFPGKIFSLKNTIIPDNYKECIPSEQYQSFDDLPEELREAIIERYNEQQQQKEIKK
jgi:hypothetical protein